MRSDPFGPSDQNAVHHHPGADRERRRQDDAAAVAEYGCRPVAAESCVPRPVRRADHSAVCRGAARVFRVRFRRGVPPAGET